MRALGSLLALTAVLFSLSCDVGRTSDDAPPPPPEGQPAAVTSDGAVRLSEEAIRRIALEVMTAEERDLPIEMSVSARVMLNDDRTALVSSFIEGIVTECCIGVGDQVREGETMSVIHAHRTHDLLAEYRQAVAAFRASQSERDMAWEAHQRESRLLELKVGSVARVQVAQNALTRAESAVESADASIEATIAHLDYLVDEIPEVIQNRESGPVPDFDIAIRAPIAGTVISRAITLGTVVAETDELYRISDLGRLWVMAQVPEVRLDDLAVGMDAAVEVRAYPGRLFHGQVTRIGTELDPETRTVQVRCEVDNPDASLKTGMYATVALRSTDSRVALVVPESAVQRLDEDAFVFRPQGDGSFQMQPITLGRAVNSSVEVVSGLVPGDEVVAHGSFLLKAEMLKSEMVAE